MSRRTRRHVAAALAMVLALWPACKDRDGAPDGPRTDGDAGLAMRKRPPNVLVVTMDTTRADRLGCYGNTEIRTPAIDRVAAEGALFEEAFAAQPVTLPSHSSIFTGRYPFNHGVRDNSIYRLAEENTTLAESLQARGYLTCAFVSSCILDHRFGLDQGFFYYNDRFVVPKQKGRLPVDRRASEVSFLAREWLDAVEGELETRPFFLWLHYYDPHADYDPPHPYATAYANPYDGEIAYMDDWLGFFIGELERRGLWDDTLVVLVADHGESLGEHGEKTHGMFIYRATTRVPLIVRYPRLIEAGTRVARRVSTVDVFPTVLEAIGAASPPGIDGRSLLPLVRGAPFDSSREIYSEVYIPRTFGWSELAGIRAGDHFYVRAPRPELYAIGPRGEETADLSAVEARTMEAMRRRLERLEADATPAAVERIGVDEEDAARLEALGYFAPTGEQAPDAGSGDEPLPDPKDRVFLFNLSQRASSLAAAGRHDEALAVLRALLDEDPRNGRFLADLAGLLIERGRYREARDRLREALERSPNDGRTRLLLARCYDEWGKCAEAAREYRAAFEAGHESHVSLLRMGACHVRLGRWEEARGAFERALELRPGDPGALNNLGYVAIKGRGDFAAGISFIERALAKTPGDPRVLASLGSALLAAGRTDEAVSRLEEALDVIPDDEETIALLEDAYAARGDREGLAALRRRKAAIEALRRGDVGR